VGDAPNSKTLDAVPNMLRELFELPPKVELKPSELPPSEAPELSTPPDPDDHPQPAAFVPVGPLVLAGGGLLLIGTGVGFGVAKNSAQSEYDREFGQLPRYESTVDSFTKKGDNAQMFATLSTVAFSVGGAVIAAAGIWFAVQYADHNNERKQAAVVHTVDEESEPPLTFAPVVGPHELGFVLKTRGVGL
jgi:hypothetical protein